MEWTEKTLEEFILQNKDKFNKYDPSVYHSDNFLVKLKAKFKKLISIVPYLFRIIIFWFIITIISILIWNNAIRKDRHEISLKQKIENIINFKK